MKGWKLCKKSGGHFSIWQVQIVVMGKCPDSGNNCSHVCEGSHFDFLFVMVKAWVMDRMTLGYSHAVDTNFYEYRSNDFLPIDISVLDSDQEGAPFHPRSLVSDQLSSQGTGSQQSSLPQNFYRSSSKQSSLTSSQGVAVSVVFLCPSESQNID